MGEPITTKTFGNYLEKKNKPLWLALNKHRTHNNKRMTLYKHHYLKEILMDTSRFRVLKKSTQGGISECLIIISWEAANSGKVVFYVLPTDGLKSRFVSNRFEKSLLYSPYYREQRSLSRSEEFKKVLIDNQSLKDIGAGVISFAGSKSDIPFVEIPADWFVVDEADKCDARRLEMGVERLGHSSDPHEIYVGNPTFIGSFLDEKFSESTKSLWFINAGCGHKVQVNFFKHVVEQIGEYDYVIRDKDFEFGSGEDIRPICNTCEKPFDRYAYGQYVDQQKSDISGKHVSRIFSGTKTLINLVNDFTKGLENDYRMQRFYNSGLGESYTAEGSKVSSKLIEDNIGDYLMPAKDKGPCIIGIDIGNEIHIRINKMIKSGGRQAVYIGKVTELPEILSLCGRYNVVAGVIDAMPELRLARKFSHSKEGYFRCFFGGDKVDSINTKEKVITASRTMAIDEMKESIVTGKILFPRNILNQEEYMDQMQEPTRVFDEDREEYIWVSNRADHYFFAEVYCNLAEKLLKFMM